MTRTGRRFQRPLGERRCRKLFVIATEGSVTEPLYFSIFNNRESVIKVKCLKRGASAPKHVLARMKKYIRDETLRATDEAWLVVDKDQWKDEQLAQLRTWAGERDEYGLAISDPKFEYWLLLHFEDCSSSSECTARLQLKLHNYDKGFDIRKFTPSMIKDAIRRARQRTHSTPPYTEVYKLVEKICNG